jgi:aminomethyltransferase
MPANPSASPQTPQSPTPQSPTSSPAPLPLAALHRQLGATLSPFGGFEAPHSYGDVAAEYRALGEGVAWVDRSWIGRLELTGADRARLLGGLMTCDVKGLAAGRGSYGFFTGKQGKILADAVVLALEDRLWLELPPGRARAIGDHIRKYIIADQVEVLPLADMLPVSILGPQAEERLAPLGSLPEAPGGTLATALRRTTLLGTEVCCVRSPVAGLPALTLWVSASIARPFLDDLLERTGIAAAGWQALEMHRVAAGVPAFGHDFDEDHFPQESGREAEGVDYAKGCYLGQEVVARIHYRGGVNRAMCRLRFEGAPPPAGSALTLESQPVGTVGSVAIPPGAEPLGLAVIHRRGFAPEAHLETATGGRALVTQVLGEIKTE